MEKCGEMKTLSPCHSEWASAREESAFEAFRLNPIVDKNGELNG